MENCTMERAEDLIFGNRRAIEALRELITYPVLYGHIASRLGLKLPRGLLLFGPPGTGKKSLVKAVVRETGAHLTILSAYSIHRGGSELLDSFSQAYSHASSRKPYVIFIDQIDVICPHAADRKEHASQIFYQLITLIDGRKISSKVLSHVIVVASTNRLDAIDPALRRLGRFEVEIEIDVPIATERLKILEHCCRNVKVDHKVDLQAIAQSCNGYVGADLHALCRATARMSCDKSSNEEQLTLMMEDWENAKSEVGPSITKDVIKELSKVSWDEIGGLKDLKKKIQQVVEWPVKHAQAFARLGIEPLRGVLLHGPPGCSKTTLAKAAAHASLASFFSLSGADLHSKYVGEGEARLRMTFQKARLAAPSILFLDEVDAIACKRGDDGGNPSGNDTVDERLLTTLLTEMDGLEPATGITVMAATNRPHVIDAALLRPGRFDLVLYVPPPDCEGRYEILLIQTREMKLGADVHLRRIAESTDLFTGADLKGLCYQAGMNAAYEDDTSDIVYSRHFEIAKESSRPSLTRSMIAEYSRWHYRAVGSQKAAF
ncbi:hypothetical protein KSP39_PZI005838 [Platanthera zijinensis]|uniref:AAA+ ATPase domain-containing protein n=1 Tax=Platanthera zijinensis TaxID=2320716 RepID=A0AAP0GB37_9ASPA